MNFPKVTIYGVLVMYWPLITPGSSAVIGKLVKEFMPDGKILGSSGTFSGSVV